MCGNIASSYIGVNEIDTVRATTRSAIEESGGPFVHRDGR